MKIENRDNPSVVTETSQEEKHYLAIIAHLEAVQERMGLTSQRLRQMLTIIARLEALQEDIESAAPHALPDARASVHCWIVINGRDVQLTLRGTDEDRLLERMQAVLAQYPPVSPLATQHGTPMSPGRHGSPEGWCAVHAVPMTSRSAHHQWADRWSHRIGDAWCLGKD